MDAFSYVMVLVSIIIGLGITHVLSAIGKAIHRARGYGSPIRLEAVYLLWVGFLFIWLISFWWWEFKFSQIEIEWTFGLYLFIVGYAVSLFLAAVILLPSEMDVVSDTFEYFLNSRRWFLSFVILLIVLDVVDTFLKGADWGLRPIFVAQTLVFVVGSSVGLVTQRRGAHLVIANAVFFVQLGYLFRELTQLGSW